MGEVKQLKEDEVMSVKEAAERELKEERLTEAKKKVKSKLKEIENAKLIVRNLERDLDDLYVQLGQ